MAKMTIISHNHISQSYLVIKPQVLVIKYARCSNVLVCEIKSAEGSKSNGRKRPTDKDHCMHALYLLLEKNFGE